MTDNVLLASVVRAFGEAVAAGQFARAEKWLAVAFALGEHERKEEAL